MMREAIVNFAQQFAFAPRVLRQRKRRYSKIIIAGMGGSALAADLLKGEMPQLPLAVHRDYGLPYISSAERRLTLVIASSYSGNTEETIDAFVEAGKQGIARAAIAIGGKLEVLAHKAGAPYVQMPDTGIQPRCALGFSMKGIAALLGLNAVNAELVRLAKSVKPKTLELRGKKFAKLFKGHIPLIYASAHNEAVAYIWKIKFNETGKSPAFYNVVPELNHNEMTGFDHTPKNAGLSKRFAALFLTDDDDHPRIGKRMAILSKLYRRRGLACAHIPLKGAGRWHKIFSSFVFADWIAYYTALQYDAEPEQVPMVEEFKKMMTL